jgi:tetratricopeptide (TPR) repeat protein
LKKALKKQIKQDEFVTFFERVNTWARSHVEEVRATVVGIVILAGVLGGLYYFRVDRAQSAARAFGEALDIFETPVGPNPSGSTFASKEEKYNRAMTAFDGVVERYASLPLGRRARYYAALCRIELDRLDDAAKDLEAVAKTKSVDADLARLALADLELRRGATDRAVDLYQKLLDEPDSPLPRDHVLMRMASALERAGRTEDAAQELLKVTQENPESVYSSEAEQRANFLRVEKDLS